MQPDIYRLFVYGSLRSGCLNEVYSYISRYFIFDGMAAVQGELYDIGEYPAAIPTTEEHLIIGEMYHISLKEEFAEAMRYLDEYEGLLVEPGEMPLFRREPIPVLFQNKSVIAWMYWYNHPLVNEPRIESGDYVAYKMGIGK
jgi:gamma-glutamylcyclotransferase (GGCT)/AIG2-like uncharacterized protein YtfP